MPRTPALTTNLQAVIYSLLAVAAATGCAGATGQLRAADYYNFSQGTTWVYQANFLGENDTRTVVMGPEKDGYFEDDAGGRFACDQEGVRDQHRYLLKQPIKRGSKWHSIAALGASEEYEIVEVGVPCEGAGQSFADCLVVRSQTTIDDDQRLENTMTLARGVGLVQIRTELVKSGARSRQVEMKLSEYRAGN